MGCVNSKSARAKLDKDGRLHKQAGVKKTENGADGFHGSEIAGLLRVTIKHAHVQQKGHYNVTLSMGLQSFLTKTSSTLSTDPEFEAVRNFAVLRNEASQLHLVVHQIRSKCGGSIAQSPTAPRPADVTPRHDRQHAGTANWADLTGVAHIDLLQYFDTQTTNDHQARLVSTQRLNESSMLVATKPSDTVTRSKSGHEQQGTAYSLRLPLTSPKASSSDILNGLASEPKQALAEGGEYIEIQVEPADVSQIEETFWQQLVALVDYDSSGTLDKDEFVRLMHGIMDDDDIDDRIIGGLWDAARAHGRKDDEVTPEVLAKVITQQEKTQGYTLLKHCPVSGALLSKTDHLGNYVYMLFQMDAGVGKNLQGGTFRTARQANRSWILKMSEWAMEPLSGNVFGILQKGGYQPGLNTQRNAAHIVVYHRYRQVLEEEIISPVVVLAMRNMYQSTFGSVVKSTGMYRYLQRMSEDRGARMDSPASKSEIQRFLKLYKDQISTEDIADDLDSFKTFNEFFYRRLKPGARPIGHPDDDQVLTSAADCRLMAFDSVEESTRFWIKGRRFSVAGLLGDAEMARQFDQSSMLIFRLAPQDYHRFHSPVAGTIRSITPIPGQLYTVNPIAVNSPLVDVFTENKRALVLIDSPAFGLVPFVAIGATLVGSIHFTVQPGAPVAKGGELGYFAFGGSTCITLISHNRLKLDSDLQRMSVRSIETYVRMGDRLGVHTDHSTMADAHPLPESVVSLAEELVRTWRATATERRLQSAADTLAEDDAGSRRSGQGDRSTTGSKWDTLRASTAWKDRDFLRTLRSDAVEAPLGAQTAVSMPREGAA